MTNYYKFKDISGHGEKAREKDRCFQIMDLETVTKNTTDDSKNQSILDLIKTDCSLDAIVSK